MKAGSPNSGPSNGLIRSICIVLLLVSLNFVFGVTHSSNAQGLSVLSQNVTIGTVPHIPAGSKFDGKVPLQNHLTFVIEVKPRSPDGLAKYAKEVSTPGNPMYQHFLRPGQAGKLFGPTQSDLSEVSRFFTHQGFKVFPFPPNSSVITVSGTVGQLSNKLHLSLSQFKLPGGRVAIANTTLPSVPSGLGNLITGFMGFDSLANIEPLSMSTNAPPLTKLAKLRNTYQVRQRQVKLLSSSTSGPQACSAAANVAANPPQNPGQGVTSPAWTSNQIASAYSFTGAYSKGDLGSGETIALFELEGFSASDIAAYQTCYSTSSTINVIPVGGGPTQPPSGEATLDIELATSFAPMATIDVYEAPQSLAGIAGDFNAIASADSAQVVSDSWGLCEDAWQKQSASELTGIEQLLEQMTAQGQSVTVASGDSGSEACNMGEHGGFLIFDSCLSASFCMASDVAGNTYEFDGNTWNYSGDPSGGSQMLVSCVTDTNCVGADSSGNVYTFDGHSWSTGNPIDSPNSFGDISCASDGFCVAVDQAGFAFMFNGSTWSGAVILDRGVTLESVDCVSKSFCIVVNEGSTAYVWNGTFWSGPNVVPGVTTLSTVSCPDANTCYLIDINGNISEYNSGSWISTGMVMGTSGILVFASCPAVGFCVGVDSKGIGYIFSNGQVVSSDVDGSVVLASLSCSSPSFCLAVGFDGDAIFYINGTWEKPVSFDSGNKSIGVDFPASSPYVTAVGGTTLESDTSPPQEQVWNNTMAVAGGGSGGGGMSMLWPMPSWQQNSNIPGVINSYTPSGTCGVPSGSYCREVPDVSASANWFQGGYVFYDNGSWQVNGGTSASAPTWASFLALANQYCSSRVGFANPVLYSIAKSDPLAFNTIYGGNNDYTGTNNGLYPGATTLQQYSLAAGLGSPNGALLLNDICSQIPKVNIPQIESISPNTGPSEGGTDVTISGTGFSRIYDVLFGTKAGLVIDATSYDSITVMAPPGSGTVDITVVEPMGTSSISPLDKFVYESRVPFHSVPPIRICDTRKDQVGVASNICNNGGAGAALGAGGVMTVAISGNFGVPANASAVVLNVTVTDTTDSSFLTIFPSGEPRPLSSNINWVSGETIPNLTTVAIGPNGAIEAYNLHGSVDVIMDLAGYYGPDISGNAGLYVPMAPIRVCDSRPIQLGVSINQCNSNGKGPIGPLSSETVQITGQNGVPGNGVEAVALNLTAVAPTSAGFLTAYPSGQTLPVVSNVNFSADQTIPNRVIVSVSASGAITIYNHSGTTNFILDVDGWFSDGTVSPANGVEFTALSPIRICDTRSNTTGVAPNQCIKSNNSSLGPGSTLTVNASSLAYVPLSAVVANVTVTNTSSSSFLTLFPGGTVPVVSDLNWVSGETIANLSEITLDSSSSFAAYNLNGSVDVIVDVEGFYT